MPFKSSLARSAGKLLGVFKERDLSLRGATQSDRVTVLGLNATGGTQSGPGGVGTALEPGNGYKYHMFTTPGSFVVTNGIFPTTIDYLLVAGGGSGGNTPDSGSYQAAGGGGAGAFRTGQITTLQVASYPVVIGTGGLYSGGPQGAAPYPGNTGWYGGNGLDSSFNAPGGNGVSAITAAGGGSGGGGTNTAGKTGRAGGSSGGGGGYASSSPGVVSATGDQYPGTGSSFPSPANGWGSDSNTGTDGGGGGGAGEAGGEFTAAAGLPAFNADTGIPPSYGTPGPSAGRWFGGGGGVGADGTGVGPFAGGAGGGGAGGVILTRPGGDGTANTGSGGGGAGADNWPSPGLGTGGNGADGIVIIKYAKYA